MLRVYSISICIFFFKLLILVVCDEQHYKMQSTKQENLVIHNIICDDDRLTGIDYRSDSSYSLSTLFDYDSDESLEVEAHDDDSNPSTKSNSFKEKTKYSRSPSMTDGGNDGIYLQDVNVHNLDGTNVTETSNFLEHSDLYVSNISSEHVIRDGSIYGNSSVIVIVMCNDMLFSTNAVSNDIEDLSVESRGRLIFSRDWLKHSEKLEKIKIHSETGLQLANNCSWLPSSVKTLDLSRSYLKSLSLTDCDNSTLENIIVGLSPTLSSLSLCLPSLISLKATLSSIDKIKTNCHRGNGKVSSLDLSKNKLTYFSTCGWPALVNLDLNSNKIASVNFGSCPCAELSSIDLSSNKLAKSPEYLPSSVIYINLSHNRIKTLSVFNNQIQEIDLSHNSLSTIGKELFKDNWVLQTLDLSHNKIDIIYGHAFDGLHELKSLNLNRNHIKHVRHEALLPLKSLQKLNLDHNKLKQLDPRLLSELPVGLKLRVKHNPWRCLCHLLAKLQHIMHSHCKPHCHNVDELECKEGSSAMSAQSILQLCIVGREEIKPNKELDNSKFQHHIKASDEDTSEEDNTEVPQEISAYAITAIVLVIVLPFFVLGARTLYLKRKSICFCFNVLAPQSPTTPIPQYTRDSQEETDSETEM